MVSEWESEREGGREAGRRRLSVVSQICRVEGGRQGGGGYLWSLRYAMCTSFLSVPAVRGFQEEGEGGDGTKRGRDIQTNGACGQHDCSIVQYIAFTKTVPSRD